MKRINTTIWNCILLTINVTLNIRLVQNFLIKNDFGPSLFKNLTGQKSSTLLFGIILIFYKIQNAHRKVKFGIIGFFAKFSTIKFERIYYSGWILFERKTAGSGLRIMCRQVRSIQSPAQCEKSKMSFADIEQIYLLRQSHSQQSQQSQQLNY